MTDTRTALTRWFEDTATTEPVELQIDGEGPTLIAPYVQEVHGLGYAWLEPDQIHTALLAVNGEGGTTYGLRLEDGDLWITDPDGDPACATHAHGRYAVGPWRWTPTA